MGGRLIGRIIYPGDYICDVEMIWSSLDSGCFALRGVGSWLGRYSSQLDVMNRAMSHESITILPFISSVVWICLREMLLKDLIVLVELPKITHHASRQQAIISLSKLPSLLVSQFV
jgi:hypothetical protein